MKSQKTKTKVNYKPSLLAMTTSPSVATSPSLEKGRAAPSTAKSIAIEA
jgi:hypothetical protein